MPNMSKISYKICAPILDSLCHTGIEGGSLTEMKRHHIKTVTAYEESHLKDHLQNRLGPVLTVIQSTPGAAEAEGVIIRCVNKKIQAVQVLAGLRYSNKN